jgi:hypothetical protein
MERGIGDVKVEGVVVWRVRLTIKASSLALHSLC